MAKQLKQDATRTANNEGLSRFVFFDGELIPFEQANISVAAHALHYGTGIFEGLRAYWNDSREQLVLFRPVPHYQRMINSCKMLKIKTPWSAEELTEWTVKLLRDSEIKESTYVRPVAFKSTNSFQLVLSGIDDTWVIFARPIGDYLDITKGLHLGVSSWRRIDDNAMPPRGKVTGAYVNSCLASEDAHAHGYDEAIVLNQDGHVAEAASANLFIRRGDQVITSPVSDGILEGVTRNTLMQLARDEFDTEIVERTIDRTELYYADEMFVCGTGVQLAPVTRVDHREIGDGQPGEFTLKLQDLYLRVARGDHPDYQDWVVPVDG